MSSRVFLAAFVLLCGIARAQGVTTLWYQTVPGANGLPAAGTQQFTSPGDLIVAGGNAAAVSMAVGGFGPQSKATLALVGPLRRALTVGSAYEMAVAAPAFSTAELDFFPAGVQVGPGCNGAGRFVVLDQVLDASSNIVAFAANFELHCAAGGALYGEFRFNSLVPLTKDEPSSASKPDPFAFFPRPDAPPASLVTSNPVTIYGIQDRAAIAIAGGEFSVNGGPFTGAPGFASNRDRVVVRQTSSSAPGATTSATLTVGGVSGRFDATTYIPGTPITAVVVTSTTPGILFGRETTVEARPPDWLFSVSQNSGQQVQLRAGLSAALIEVDLSAPSGALLQPGPYEQAMRFPASPATPRLDSFIGINSTPCATAGGRFVIHEFAVASDGSVERLAASFEQLCETTGPIYGEVRINSTIPLPFMLAAPRTMPYPFALDAQSPVRAGSVVRSTSTTIDGIDVPVPISIVGGEYSVNGGAFTSAAGMVSPRDDVVVRLVASRFPGAVRTATLTAGGRSATLSVQTYLPGTALSGLYYRSDPGVVIARGATDLLLAPPNEMTIQAGANPDTIQAWINFSVGDRLFAAYWAPNGAPLAPGPYENAVPPTQTTPNPMVDFLPGSGSCFNSTGRFVVREVARASGNLERFAVDFQLDCGITGEVRFNSAVPFSALEGGACTSADPACVADVAVTQSGSGTPIAGQDMSLTLAVTNHGPGTAHGVTLTEALPAHAQTVIVPDGCSLAGSTLMCVIGALASGDTATYNLVLRPSLPGPLGSAVNVSAEEIDPVAANNDDLTTLQVAAPARAVNISTRGRVGVGGDVLIGGFIIGGATPKTVVVTAIGPALSGAGIPNALANPTLTLVRSSDGAVIATNDDWGTAANATQIQQSGLAPADAHEPAIMMTLPPGAYTAIVSGAGGLTGVGIVAVYEVDHPEVPLVNISTRGNVLTGDDVMIGGFVIQGAGPRTVVVTAIGPSLVGAGIPNALANPTLTLVRSSDGVVLATNDDWAAAANAAQVRQSGFAPADARESAIMMTLPPGAYTAIVSGAGGLTGVGIVAVYSVP